MSRDLKVFGGPNKLADGRNHSCYTVEWVGKEPPTAIQLGDYVYLLVTDPCGHPVERRVPDGS